MHSSYRPWAECLLSSLYSQMPATLWIAYSKQTKQKLPDIPKVHYFQLATGSCHTRMPRHQQRLCWLRWLWALGQTTQAHSGAVPDASWPSSLWPQYAPSVLPICSTHSQPAAGTHVTSWLAFGDSCLAEGVWQITCEHCELKQQLPRIPVLTRMTMIWMDDRPCQYMKCRKWRYALHKTHVHTQLPKTEPDSCRVRFCFCYTLTVCLVCQRFTCIK